MIKIEIVKIFLENGFSVLPVTDRKLPIGNWKAYQSRQMNETELLGFNQSNATGIAIAAGRVSGGLEIIDIDSKYDLTGNLYDDYMNEIPKSLREKLVIQKTANNGYHLIYRCQVVEGNQKLAQRYVTEQEQKSEIVKLREKNIGRTEDELKKSVSKVRDLLETRGEGGYFLVQPSIGYKIIQGKLSYVATISEQERDTLLEIARSFNEVVKEQYKPIEVKKSEQYYHISPFEDYNQKCDVPQLLEQHGWKIARVTGAKYLMQRPATENKWSAEYDRDKNWFTVFSSSTEFEMLKAYKPYAVWATLNNVSDWSEANTKLIQMGFGVKNEAFSKNKKETFVGIFKEDEYDDGDNDITFLANWVDVRKKVEDFIEGKIPIGLYTGYPKFDEYFRFKRGNLVVVNGHDNTGKSTMMLWFAMISAIKHGWKWCLYCSENSDLNVMNVLIQFYCAKPIRECTVAERDEAQTLIENHFAYIRPDELVDYHTLKKQIAKLHRVKPMDACLIDPFNSLDASQNANTHEFNYAVVTDMKLWGRKNDVSIYLNCHAVTSSMRKKDDDGYIQAPDKADTEGGTKFAAKADEFLTIHRVANHSDENIRKITEIHVRKIRDTMTGGKQTSKDEPFKLIWGKGGAVFFDADRYHEHPFLKPKEEIDFEDMINEGWKAPF